MNTGRSHSAILFDNSLPYVKPIVLIACRDTNHAKEIRALIDSDGFQGGRYKGKVIESTNMKGEETEENGAFFCRLRMLQTQPKLSFMSTSLRKAGTPNKSLYNHSVKCSEERYSGDADDWQRTTLALWSATGK